VFNSVIADMKFNFTKNIKKGILLFAAIGVAFVACAQDNDDNEPDTRTPTQKESTIQAYYPFSLEAGGELCFPIENFALVDNFNGVYSWHVSGQFMLFKHFEGGFEFQNLQLATAASEQARTVYIISTNEFFYNLGVKLSYYSSESSQWFFNPSFVVGQSWIVFDNVLPCPRPPGGYKQQAFFLTPRVSEGIRVDDALRIGASVDYTFVNYAFSPTYVGITSKQYNSQQTIKPSQFLSWGFYATYFFGRPKT
jgi:hypothetical protein